MTNGEEHFHNGFRYSIDYADENNIPVIEHSKPRPDFLFKYYPMNNYSVNALTYGYFYASHPLELNDCLDSSPLLLFTSKPLEFELYDKFFGFMYENNRQKLIDYWKEDCEKESRCKGYIANMYTLVTSRYGLISMTEKENHTLMWPHYTGEKGFQLKFRAAELEESIENNLKNGKGQYLGLHPINYVNELKPIDIYPFKTLYVPFAYSANVKAEDWEYEQEWRFLISNFNMGVPFSKAGLNTIPDIQGNIKNRKTYYDSDLIVEICLGRNFFTQENFEIEQITKMEFRVKPKHKTPDDINIHEEMMKFISSRMNDRVYHSGVKYEFNEKGSPFLMRTKEQIEIKLQEGGWYQLNRTANVIKYMGSTD